MTTSFATATMLIARCAVQGGLPAVAVQLPLFDPLDDAKRSTA